MSSGSEILELSCQDESGIFGAPVWPPDGAAEAPVLSQRYFELKVIWMFSLQKYQWISDKDKHVFIVPVISQRLNCIISTWSLSGDVQWLTTVELHTSPFHKQKSYLSPQWLLKSVYFVSDYFMFLLLEFGVLKLEKKVDFIYWFKWTDFLSFPSANSTVSWYAMWAFLKGYRQ